MRKIKEVLRLKWGCGLSNRTVAGSCAISPSTVLEYLRRATRAGLGWPLPEGLGDAELEARMFAPVAAAVGQPRPLPGMEERCLILYTFSKKFAMTGWGLQSVPRKSWTPLPNSTSTPSPVRIISSIPGSTSRISKKASAS